MSASAAYAELHCLSNFTFLTGASHPEELVSHAGQLGYAALAITDECSLAGVVRAHTAARDCALLNKVTKLAICFLTAMKLSRSSLISSLRVL